MMFVGDLCIVLGRTLAEVLALSAAEVEFWRQYKRKRGFPADRGEWATALAGVAVARPWGSKVEPKDLIPDFDDRPHGTDMKLLAAQLAALPGAKVRRIPRPERKAQREAERKARGEQTREHEQKQPEPKSRVLNPTPKPKR